jgi:hypothetical protein
MKYWLIFGLGVLALLGAEITLTSREWVCRAQLRTDATRLERIAGEQQRLEADNARLRGEVGQGDLPEQQKLNTKIQKARVSLNQMQLRVRQMKRALGQSVDPVWPEGAEVKPASKWTFAGQSSPANTLESVLWAARAGDVDRLATLIHFEAGAHAAVQALFNNLPDSARAQYGTPEKIVATLFAAKMPDTYAAMATLWTSTPQPGTAYASLRLQDGGGNQQDLTFKFEQDHTAWQLDVPESVVANYIRPLQATVEPSPSR